MGNPIVNQPSWSQMSGRLATCHRVLEEAGLEYKDLQLTIDDPDARKRLVEYWKAGCPDLSVPTVPQVTASHLQTVADRLIGIEDWKRFYPQVKFSEVEVPTFPMDILEEPCSFHKGKRVIETHTAFLGLENVNGQPLHILNFQTFNPKAGKGLLGFYSYAPEAWYSTKEEFAIESLNIQWYLLLTDIVPGSTGKLFKKEQVPMLPSEYEVPSLVEETAKNLLHFKKFGVYPNPNVYARTSSLASHGGRVNVGSCNDKGIDINDWRDDHNGLIGVGARRKL